MIVRELITRLGFSLNQSQLNNAERATERVKDRAEQAAAAFRDIVASIASIATVKAIVGIADEMQNIRTRIGQLPQTVGDAGAAFDVVAARASEAGVKIEAYASLYTKVGNAAKDYIKTQEDLLGITDTISKALVVGGASAQEASAVMTQFSQALASGVLQGDEFRSMAEAAPQYLDKLAEVMKIPREQLKKMASDGKLTAKAVIEATRRMSDYFGDKLKEMPMTVGRAMTVVGNRFARMIDKMNRDSNFVTTIANGILTAFDKIEAGVYKLVEAFGGWNNMLRFVGIAIGVAFGAKVISILMAFRTVAWTAALPFLKIAAIITLVTLLLEDLYVWIQGGDSLIGQMIGPWEEWRDVVMGSVEAVMAVFRWFGELIAAVAATLVGAFTLDWNLFAEGLKGIGALLWQVVGQWGIWIRDAFVFAFDAVLGFAEQMFNAFAAFALSVFENIGKMVVGAFTLDPKLFFDGLQGYTQVLLSILPEWAQTIYKAIFDPIVSAVTDAWNAVKGVFGTAWEGAKNFVGAGSGTAGGTAAGATPASTVTPAQLTGPAMGQGRPNINNQTQVNVTVPPGTTAEQAAFLQNAAQKSFNKATDDKLARDLAVYAP